MEATDQDRKIKVLIVDDSVVYRSQVRAALEKIENVSIVGVAASGKIALDKVKQSPVDLIILDLEMPEMSGIEVLKNLNSINFKGKILVFSAVSKRGADITLTALSLGAADFVTKPGPQLTDSQFPVEPSEKIRELIAPKITAIFPENNTNNEVQTSVHIDLPVFTSIDTQQWTTFLPEILVIGSSTGGPTMLERIFAELKLAPLCPFLIVQHMPPVFTATLAERLSKISGLSISEAKNGMPIEKGKGYLAPGDFHMTVRGSAEGPIIELNQGPQINSVRPAVDPLFESAAKIFKARCLGIVLTGMGADGKDGSIKIKEHGGSVVIQSEKSCVVFGMPGAVKSVNAYDFELCPDEIINILKQKVFTSFRFAV